MSYPEKNTRREGKIRVYLGLGSNLGDRQGNLMRALDLLASKITMEQVSSLYHTEPVGYLKQPWFLNAACQASTILHPHQLLGSAKEIESLMGRTSTFPNSPRPIDIDILFYGDQVINTPQLTIPHPRLAERAFVLVPLAELAPQLVHPVSRKTIGELLGETGGLEGIQRWKAQERIRANV